MSGNDPLAVSHVFVIFRNRTCRHSSDEGDAYAQSQGNNRVKITRIDCHVLLVPDYNEEACSSAQDDLVVVIHTDEGIRGIGETDTNPWVARECIRARGTHCMGLGLEEMLIGADPLEPETLWQKLYSGSKMTGRRGAMICAMGAIDMALWDIRGKASQQPVHELLGGAVKDHITPYASLLPEGRTLTEYRESLVAAAANAREHGFVAGKMEVCVKGPYSHNGLQERDEAIVEIVAACRAAVGPDFVMMVAYRSALLEEWDRHCCQCSSGRRHGMLSLHRIPARSVMPVRFTQGTRGRRIENGKRQDSVAG